MPVVTTPEQFNVDDLFVDLEPTLGQRLLLKCEGFNFAGSIKLKAAQSMVEAAERAGLLRPGAVLVESSSGNLGVALAMIAAHRGYRFVCVTDKRCNLISRQTMEAVGAEVHVIDTPSPHGGLLGARIEHVQALCATDARYVWLNQYANAGNWQAHFRTTAPAIMRAFPHLDVLVVGAGTTGTLMGCARFLRRWHPTVRIVAVDVVGSVTFGGPAATRCIPGLGTSVRPPMVDPSYVDDLVMVDELDGVQACRTLARNGFLFGGSTGQVVSGACAWLADQNRDDLTTVAIAPDLGERYLDTLYRSEWVEEQLGDDIPQATVAELVWGRQAERTSVSDAAVPNLARRHTPMTLRDRPTAAMTGGNRRGS